MHTRIPISQHGTKQDTCFRETRSGMAVRLLAADPTALRLYALDSISHISRGRFFLAHVSSVASSPLSLSSHIPRHPIVFARLPHETSPSAHDTVSRLVTITLINPALYDSCANILHILCHHAIHTCRACILCTQRKQIGISSFSKKKRFDECLLGKIKDW